MPSPSAIRVAALLIVVGVFGSHARAGAGPYQVLLVDGSSANAGERATRLFELVHTDVMKVFGELDVDGANVRVVSRARAATAFAGECAAQIRDKAAFDELVAGRQGLEVPAMGVIFYCYDGAAKKVTFILFDQGGREMTRIVTETRWSGAMTGLILKNERAALVSYLGAMFPYHP